MNKLVAYKMDGLGNDFIIFDKRKKSISLTKDQIIKISSRSNIGCDQVIFIDEEIKKEPFQQVLEFNETYGFPEYIYFNREEMLVDEEIGYTISSFNID